MKTLADKQKDKINQMKNEKKADIEALLLQQLKAAATAKSEDGSAAAKTETPDWRSAVMSTSTPPIIAPPNSKSTKMNPVVNMHTKTHPLWAQPHPSISQIQPVI